jgi:uncharacterized protein (DUF885 family)
MAAPGNPGPGMADFVRRFEADRGDVERFYNLPWSEARFDRLAQVFKAWESNLNAVDFEALDQSGRIDYLLLRNKLAEEQAHLALDRRRLAEIGKLVPFRAPVQNLEQARWLTAPVNAAAAAEIVAAIPDQIKKLRDRLEKEGGETKPKDAKAEEKDKKAPGAAETNSEPKIKISAALARRTAAAVGAVRDALNEWFGFYDGSVPEFSWWVKKPRDEADKALEDYAKFLREEIAGLKGKDEDPLVGDPIGAEALADDLAAESIPYSTDELIDLAEREFAWCEAQMRKASGEMGMGENWKAALAKVKSDYSPPGKQDELVAALSREAIRFVKDRDLVTIPPLCEETWRLTMSSPETQKSLPYAAYGGQNMMVAYAKEEMKNDDKLMSMRGNNRHFTRIVVAHELIPGHHLQLFMSERNQTHRSIFHTPFFVEGWALSWELRLWELGYPQTPEDRVGMLFWRMHRCARIIVSLKFHLGKMTPAGMVDFLVDRVGHERLGATSETRRYIGGAYSPLYQCSYLLGGMQLRALRREAVDSGKMTEKQFNDAVLGQNAIPIEMVRAAILSLPLSRDTKPNWRFAEGEPELNRK